MKAVIESNQTRKEVIANDIDANLISDKIDNIDTNVIEAQIQDLLITVNQQNEKIDKIEKKIDTILNKI